MKKNLIYAIICSILSLTIGCSKQPAPPAHSGPLKTMGATASAGLLIPDDPSNSANLYDSFGLKHNNALDAIYSTWTAPGATFHQVYAALQTYVGGVMEPEVTVRANVQAIVNDLPNNCSNVIAASTLSTAGKNYLTTLVNTGLNFDADSTYADWNASVAAVEAIVLNDGSLPASDKEIILEAASTYRYSVKYWSNYYYATDPGGFDFNDDNALQEKSIPGPGKIWRAVKSFVSKNLLNISKVGLSDAGGALKSGGVWTRVANAGQSSILTGVGIKWN